MWCLNLQLWPGFWITVCCAEADIPWALDLWFFLEGCKCVYIHASPDIWLCRVRNSKAADGYIHLSRWQQFVLKENHWALNLSTFKFAWMFNCCVLVGRTRRASGVLEVAECLKETTLNLLWRNAAVFKRFGSDWWAAAQLPFMFFFEVSLFLKFSVFHCHIALAAHLSNLASAPSPMPPPHFH